MARLLYLCLALVLALSLGSCSSGSSSGGGSSATDTTTTGTTGTTGTSATGSGTTSTGDAPITTNTISEKDLTGTWNYVETVQGSGKSCTGTMTFVGTRLTGITNSCCPSDRQAIVTPEFWIWSDGYVKGRNYAWCTDTQQYAKYSMNFDKNSNKKRITGLLDVHLDPQYTRFDITLTR